MPFDGSEVAARDGPSRSRLTRQNRLNVVMVFGRKLAIVDSVTYLGFALSSKGCGLLRRHYDDKAAKAQRVGRGICALEHLIGSLPPDLAVKLYMVLVDPHLIHGCEVMPDINKTALGELSDVQKAFLQRALGLSIICALFTETGLNSLEFRRLDLTLGYWYYIVMCPSTRYVYQALVEAIQLDYDGHRSWVSDLRTAVAREAAELTFPAHPDLMNGCSR